MLWSKRVSHLLGLAPTCLLALAAGVLAAPQAVSAAEAALLATYDKSDGTTYFALSLTPKPVERATGARDVLVLFDTSASQIGVYRDDALAALDTLLGSLDPGSRVKLMAVDLQAVALSEGFVAPGSEAMRAAVDKLRRRVPLGSTDMKTVLGQVPAAFADAPGSPRVVVYLGDGQSKAGYLGPREYAAAVDALVGGRISFNSLAIGPHRDAKMLAALANVTGGNFLVDTNETSPQQAGMALAGMAAADVYWPVSVTLPAAMREVYPQRVPPLRSDRDTILVGVLAGRNPVEVKISAEVAGQPVELAWTVAPERSSEDHAYLPQLVEVARVDQGVSLPTAGSAALREASRLVAAAATDLARMASSALASGDIDGAERLAQAALARDPADTQARSVLGGVARARAGAAPDDADLRIGGAAEEGSLLAEFEAGLAGDFLTQVEQQRMIQEQILKTEVDQGLRNARNQMNTNPRGVQNELKLLLESVERAPDVSPDVKAQMVDQLVSAIREAARREVVVDQQRQLENERRAAAQDRQRLLDALARREETLKQVLARFNALMDETRYREAADAAMMARDMAPEAEIGEVAVINARMTGAYREFMAVREARHRNFVDTMFQVERSHVPFPDDPPITYPDPEVWEGLTLRRKKYAAVDLARRGGAEERIFMALQEPTTLEFIETPLEEVVNFLKDLHGIEIQIDSRALADVGLGSDTPITRNLQGITLRSALRLMLKDLDLTYVVRDEVLLITTPEEAESKLVTKVYPVADLVLPISSGVGSNPFMLGGGLGGMGGFGGGMGMMGGGMGGMGGFGGGMDMFGGGMGGMGGMGGGMFSVEDTPAESRIRITPDAGRSATPAPVASPATAPADIPLSIAAGETADAAWNRYFAENAPDAADVREAVRVRMNAHKFDEVVALLYGALRHGQAQPWMYEAIGLALQAKGAPDAEIERALMSAVDFGASEEDLIYAAIYMARVGLDRRALSLLEYVSKLSPLRPEPYLHALAIARRLGDLEAQQWIALGILRQAWPQELRYIEAEAYRTAHAALEQLRSQRRHDEAKQLEQEIQQARIRDVVVRVSWTGEAGVDLMIEEPSGTICSLRNPRTTAGGVLVGTGTATLASTASQGAYDMYLCPEAFAGTYRMLLRRVWGNVTAGTVTVDIYTNHGTPNQQHLRKQIPLAERDAVVIFDLEHGRRTEPLTEHQVAAAAQNQLALSRAVLAQQINAAAAGSNALNDYLLSRAVAYRDGRLYAPRARGGVGYRPVITTLPEGANLTATAVISADRRYVRITAIPLFSSIGEVYTFNFTTGDTNIVDDGGDGGNGGGGGGGGGVGAAPLPAPVP